MWGELQCGSLTVLRAVGSACPCAIAQEGSSVLRLVVAVQRGALPCIPVFLVWLLLLFSALQLVVESTCCVQPFVVYNCQLIRQQDHA